MGRRQQPAAIKEAKGNPGRRPIAKEGAASAPSAMAAPRTLKAGPRRVWEKLAPELAGMRILKPSDLTAFRRYCVFVSKWGDLEPLLERAEIVVTTVSAHNPDGMERKSQLLLAALMLDKRLSEIEDRFGMNPSARQRLFLQMAASPSQLPLEPTAKPEQPAEVPMTGNVPAPASPVGLLN